MGKNRLAIASLLLVALVGAAIFQVSSREKEYAPKAKAEIELPEIEQDAIDQLVIAAPDKPEVTLVKQDEGWALTAPVADEADENAVESALSKLGELEYTGVAATAAKNHERLEVDDAKGTHVIAKSGDQILLDAYIGKFRSGNTMLRLQGQEPVAKVRGSIRYAFDKELKGWRDRTITKVSTDDVVEVELHNSEADMLFRKEGDTWVQVKQPGDAMVEDLDESKLKGIVGSAASLNAVDFADEGTTAEQASLGEGAATFTLRLSNDAGAREVSYRIGGAADKNYYLQREGDPQVYLISAWLRGRLTANTETLKKPEPQDPSKPRKGSRENPIVVEPQRVEHKAQ
ncbi:MAG: DUF4340 domain-containing protein [Myxococcales bacterium]|jgi:hypothetical protein